VLFEPGRFEPIIVLETRGARTLLPILRRRLHARTGRGGGGDGAHRWGRLSRTCLCPVLFGRTAPGVSPVQTSIQRMGARVAGSSVPASYSTTVMAPGA